MRALTQTVFLYFEFNLSSIERHWNIYRKIVFVCIHLIRLYTCTLTVETSFTHTKQISAEKIHFISFPPVICLHFSFIFFNNVYSSSSFIWILHRYYCVYARVWNALAFSMPGHTRLFGRRTYEYEYWMILLLRCANESATRRNTRRTQNHQQRKNPHSQLSVNVAIV